MCDLIYNTVLYIIYVYNCRFNQCYGVVGLLDYLHGTCDMFHGSRAYDRHRLLLGLTPAKELYPDVKTT